MKVKIELLRSEYLIRMHPTVVNQESNVTRVQQVRTRPDMGVLESNVRTYFCPDILIFVLT